MGVWYDQTSDVTAAELSQLPANPSATGLAAKQPNIIAVAQAADQVALLAAGLPTFSVAVHRLSTDLSAAFDSTQGPPLRPDESGNAWVVTQIAAPLAASRLWQMLLDPHTFGS